jgi:hypothetical protein
MKHHGNYDLQSVEELRLSLELGAQNFVAGEMDRLRKKHRNTKRHKEKQRRKNRNYV